jgi:plasmid maintenance system killer protein
VQRCPVEIRSRYDVWKEIAEKDGSSGLRALPGYRDGALKGKLAGLRSSRLGNQYRVVYQVHAPATIEVVAVTPHAYDKIRH